MYLQKISVLRRGYQKLKKIELRWWIKYLIFSKNFDEFYKFWGEINLKKIL